MRTICFCNSNIPWGGGEKWHFEAALSFAQRGWQVFVLCHPKGELFTRACAQPSIQVVPVAVGRLSFLNPLLLGKLAEFFRQHSVHAVILNLPSDVKTAGRAAHKAGVKHIYYRRGSALPVKDTCFNRYLYGQVISGLIVNSEATKTLALKNNPKLIPEERIMLLPNGIDLAAFDQALSQAAPLTLPHMSPEPMLTLGNAGRLNKQKGQHYLLYLTKALADNGLPVRTIIAGEGERRQELEALAGQLGISGQAVFTGFMDDLAPFWKSIDIFVLSSLWEGFGFVLAEAMLAEKPVLAFNVSNIPEIVEDGLSGRLFPVPEERPGQSPNMAALAKAVAELAASPERCQSMGRAGRQKARECYSQQRSMDALEALLG